jgi:hypothetical protein
MSNDVEHYQDLLRIKRRRLQVLERQASFAGENTASAAVLLEIEDLRDEIETLLGQIRAIEPGFEASAGRPTLPSPPPTSSPPPVSFSQKQELVQSLLNCRSISDSNAREAVLRQLPANIYQSITANHRADVHMLNVVDACLNYQGGIESLIGAVRFFERGSRQMQELDVVIKRIFPG